MKGAGEKNAIIKSISAKLSSNALRTKVNSVNVLQPMALLQDLPRATPGNRLCSPGESKAECHLLISLASPS